MDRNYLVYACINGTCKDYYEDRPDIYDQIDPVARIDKIPDDISEVTKICLEKDKKDYSRLTGMGVLETRDLEILQDRIYSLTHETEGYGLKYDLEDGIFKTYICGESIARHEGFDDARIVFWFSN